MQHVDPAFWIAEDEYLAVAELALLDRFLHGHGTHGNRVTGLHQVGLGGAGDGRKLVHHHRDRRSRVRPDRDLHLSVAFYRGLPALVLGFPMSIASPAIVAEH